MQLSKINGINPERTRFLQDHIARFQMTWDTESQEWSHIIPIPGTSKYYKIYFGKGIYVDHDDTKHSGQCRLANGHWCFKWSPEETLFLHYTCGVSLYIHDSEHNDLEHIVFLNGGAYCVCNGS